METLSIAVIIDEDHSPTEGGGYSYYHALTTEIDRYKFPDKIQVHFLTLPDSKSKRKFSKPVLQSKFHWIQALQFRILKKAYGIVHFLYQDKPSRLLETLAKNISLVKNAAIFHTLTNNAVDLVYYLKPNDYPVEFPMIATHWDVAHKSIYPFPEVADNGNWEKRESYYLNILNKAFLILCESEAGKEELSAYYAINPLRIRIVPLFAGEVVRMHIDKQLQQKHLVEYALEEEKFFVYPAQFWAHKNHYNLIVAFKNLLAGIKENIKLVLCGAGQGNMGYIKNLINALQLADKVIITGFVSDEVLHTFYRTSIALIMPTYLGPTNIPLIEAATLGCPVICSDFKGHREILGDAALYFNPAKAEEIQEGMSAMMNRSFRQSIIDKASARIAESPFRIEKSVASLAGILEEIRPVRRAWGSTAGFLPFVFYAEWAYCI